MSAFVLQFYECIVLMYTWYFEECMNALKKCQRYMYVYFYTHCLQL